MGKKRIIQKTEKELLQERDKVESKVQKDIKVKSSKQVQEAKIFISSTYNNTVITLTDLKGNVLLWSSAGNIGFKGTKKGTPFAASKVAEAIFQALQKLGVQRIHIFVKGTGSGRDSAIRSLSARDLEILSIKDITPIPHNGCRARKPRRV